MLAKINTASATALFVATVWCCLALLVGSTVAQGNESPGSGSASMTDNVLSWARIAQAVATAIALVLGGIFAWRRGFIFRHQQPHVTVSHDVTHRHIGHGYVHIEVTATLHNTSRVKVEFRDGLFTVEQLAPVTGDRADLLFKEIFDKDLYESPKWVILRERRLEWTKDGLIVEPGEKATATLEHIVSDAVESVLITTFFYNTRVFGKIPSEMKTRNIERRRRFRWLWRTSGPRGWTRTTAYDINPASYDLESGQYGGGRSDGEG